MKNKTLAFTLFVIHIACSFALAQTDLDAGIRSFKSGDLDAAAASFKKATKAGPNDARAWSYLGLTYLKQNEIKDSIKALKTAGQLNPNETMVHIGLGYAYLSQNKLPEARTEAELTLKLEPKSAEANYIIGVVNFRNASYTTAYERANAALAITPEFPQAYLLKAQSLVISFVQQANTVIRPPESRYSLLKEAEESLAEYLRTAPKSEETQFYTDYLGSIKFFSDYYNGPNFKTPSSVDAQADPGTTPLKIIDKPRARYTSLARSNGVSGTVRLMAGFSADGKVSHVLVVKPLSHGLSEEAVRAARGIKFEPAKRDGKPVSVVKTLEYHFQIY